MAILSKDEADAQCNHRTRVTIPPWIRITPCSLTTMVGAARGVDGTRSLGAVAVGDETPWGAVISAEVFVDGRLVEVEVRNPDGSYERTYVAAPAWTLTCDQSGTTVTGDGSALQCSDPEGF